MVSRSNKFHKVKVDKLSRFTWKVHGYLKRCKFVCFSSYAADDDLSQNLGFYCALPLDPSKTHMECIPIPKS